MKMKIAVVSDTHGSLETLSALFDKIKGVDVFIHLGDDSPDAEIFEKRDFNVIKVPGVYESIYILPDTKRRIIQEFCGKKFLITHTRSKHSNDLPTEPGPEELSKNVDVILFGHTHVPTIEIDENKKIWINPGHLKLSDRRGYPPSYAVINIDSEKFEITIYNLLTDEKIFEKIISC
ncbi:MAG: metallophosphoesterase family protein [Endomicrobiia bacterium]